MAYKCCRFRHQGDGHGDAHGVAALQQPQTGVTGHVVGIGGVVLRLETNKTTRFSRLIEHQEGGIAGHLQPLPTSGMLQLGRTMLAAVTVVEPPLRALPLAKIEVGRKPARPVARQMIRPLLPDAARQKANLCLFVAPEERVKARAVETGRLPQMGQADPRQQAPPL